MTLSSISGLFLSASYVFIAFLMAARTLEEEEVKDSGLGSGALMTSDSLNSRSSWDLFLFGGCGLKSASSSSASRMGATGWMKFNFILPSCHFLLPQHLSIPIPGIPRPRPECPHHLSQWSSLIPSCPKPWSKVHPTYLSFTTSLHFVYVQNYPTQCRPTHNAS